MISEDTGTRSDRRTGILIAGATALISGVAVFVNGYGVRAWTPVTDTATYTTAKNLVAAGVLVGVALLVTGRGGRDGLVRPRGSRQIGGLALVAVIGGSVPFLLFFEGLARASSVEAAFIHKTLVIWVGVLAVVLLKERIGAWHLVAAAMLVSGQALVAGGLGGFQFGLGEVLITIATLLWAVEVVVAKWLLGGLSSSTVAVARMGGGAVLLVAYGLLRGAFSGLGGLGPAEWTWVLFTGLVLAGYVGTWFAALARAQAVDVTAVLVGGAVITALLRAAVDSTPLPSALGLGLVTAGVVAVLMVNVIRPSRHAAVAPR